MDRPVQRIRFFVIIFVLFVSSPSVAADRAAYRGIDVLRDLRPDRKGVPMMAAFTLNWSKNLESLKITDHVMEAYAFADDVIESVHFERLLTSPIGALQPDQSRVFSLIGSYRHPSFILEYQAAPIAKVRCDRVLDFGTELRVREDKHPIPEEKRGFGLEVSAKVNLGDLSHETWHRGVAGILRILDPGNLNLLARSYPAAESITYEQVILSEMRKIFPDASARAERYFKPKIQITIKKSENPKIEFSEVTATLKLDIDRLEVDYPDLGYFLRHMLEKFQLESVLKSELVSGLGLSSLQFDSHQKTVSLSFVTTAGQLIPSDRDGHFYPEYGVDYLKLKKQEELLSIAFDAHVLGLQIQNEGIIFQRHFEDGSIAKSSSQLIKFPVPRISGRALGLFPTWVIDLSIPASLSEYSRRFSEGLLRGVKGARTRIELDFSRHEGASTQLQVSAGSELIDNFFINFGMRIIQRYIWPKQKVLHDGWYLSRDLSEGMTRDFAKLMIDEGKLE